MEPMGAAPVGERQDLLKGCRSRGGNERRQVLRGADGAFWLLQDDGTGGKLARRMDDVRESRRVSGCRSCVGGEDVAASTKLRQPSCAMASRDEIRADLRSELLLQDGEGDVGRVWFAERTARWRFLERVVSIE